MLTCKEAIALLGEYLESALGPEAGADLERHLQECEACTAYLNTYGKSRELTATVARAEMPEEMRTRLRDYVIGKLAGNAGPCGRGD
jgi:predicted anti-sigma-YlaC factor YlaD